MTSALKRPTVGVVVANWNDTATTIRCLRSLPQSGAFATLPVVVDSGSERDPTAALAAAVPLAEVLRVENRGYAAACNAGARLALARGAGWLLFLNNDTTLGQGALEALLAAARERPGALLGPLIVHEHDPRLIWSAGGYLTRPWLKNHHIGEGEPVQAHRVARRVQWTTGCAIFCSSETYRRLGPMDEGFFLYLEDVDWCLRAAAGGIPVWFTPEAVVHHSVSRSVSRVSPSRRRYYAYRNHYRFAYRHSPVWFKPVVVSEAFWTLAKALVRSLYSPAHLRDYEYHARTRAVLDFLRNRRGSAFSAPPPPAGRFASPGPGA